MGEGTAALINPFGAAMRQAQAKEYEGVRPTYPDAAYQAVLAGRAAAVVDVGAGTGQFTRGLTRRGVPTTAVEPSEAMRQALQSKSWARQAEEGGILEVLPTSAEATGLPEDSADAVVWAQCSHWLDIPAAAAEAARILRRGGTLSVVSNQLAVQIPWVHRLSRIMRSGDVVRRDRSPDLGPLFGPPALVEVPWGQALSVTQCLALARTRSSYLAADEGRQAKMQENLRWYLLDHLGLDPARDFFLPYRTLVWSAQVRG